MSSVLAKNQKDANIMRRYKTEIRALLVKVQRIRFNELKVILIIMVYSFYC